MASGIGSKTPPKMSEQAQKAATDAFVKYTTENPRMLKLTKLVITNPYNEAVKHAYFKAVEAFAIAQGHDQIVESFSKYFNAGSGVER